MKYLYKSKPLLKICDWLVTGTTYLQIFTLIFVCVIICSRSIFNHVINGGAELVALFMLVFASAGAGDAHIHGQHVQMTAIIDRLPEKVRCIFDIVIHFLGSVYLVFYCYSCWDMTLKAIRVHDRVSSLAVIYTWWARMLYAIGFTLFLIVMILKFIDSIRKTIRLFKGESVEEVE